MRPADGHLTLIDRRSGETWSLGRPYVLQMDQRMVPVRPSGEVVQSRDALSYPAEWGLEFEVRLAGNALQYSFRGGFQGFTCPEIQEVRLLSQALAVPEDENSYYAVPSRMGLLLRADGNTPFSRRMDAYRTGAAVTP